MGKDSVNNYSQIIETIFSTPNEELGLILADVRTNLAQYTLGELACYLRGCYTRAENIPNYHALRLAVIEHCKSIGGDLHIFRGLVDYVPWKPMF